MSTEYPRYKPTHDCTAHFGPWRPKAPGEEVDPEYVQPVTKRVKIGGKAQTITEEFVPVLIYGLTAKANGANGENGQTMKTINGGTETGFTGKSNIVPQREYVLFEAQTQKPANGSL